ncbi:hypothetical protein CDAR_298641 [Caerostris darwini]|uniref:Uncharacterized protein n=1 Tax=Caerostris darwini TaxID=1538125 RepID=A0AAV4MUL7_9ARAC|nr:hypothetical protein CDAR_298641 [Caerostris darwini]
MEECSKRIRAICTYTGVLASLLPSKKELIEMRKAKDLEILAKETETSTQPQPTKVIPATITTQASATAESQPTGSANKRKTPVSDDDEGSYRPNRPNESISKNFSDHGSR